MSKKIIISITTIITLVALAAVAFAHLSFRRPAADTFIEMVIWPGIDSSRNPPVSYLIVKNDGTFISYFGNSRNHRDMRRRNFMRTVSERQVTTLNEQEFQNISRLINAAVAGYYRDEYLNVWAHSHFVLRYNENLYNFRGPRTLSFQKLVNELSSLSPIRIW